MSISVVEVTGDGRPVTVDFTFRDPLESSRYAWLNWRDGKLAPFTPPKLNGHEYRAELSGHMPANGAE